jgi:hypothetical protein
VSADCRRHARFARTEAGISARICNASPGRPEPRELGHIADARLSRSSGDSSRVAARPLLRFVRFSSEWAIQAVRQDCSFAKKQEFPPALLPSSKASWRPAQHARSPLHDAGVVCQAHAGVAASLIGSVSPASGAVPLPRRGRPWFAYGAEHVPRIGRGVRHGPRPGASSRSAACPGKGILGRVPDAEGSGGQSANDDPATTLPFAYPSVASG